MQSGDDSYPFDRVLIGLCATFVSATVLPLDARNEIRAPTDDGIRGGILPLQVLNFNIFATEDSYECVTKERERGSPTNNRAGTSFSISKRNLNIFRTRDEYKFRWQIISGSMSTAS